MYMLKNKNGVLKEVKKGFSFTVFFFGFIVPFIRGDWKWGLIMLLVTSLSNLAIPIVAPMIVQTVFAVIYNKMYMDDLLNDGYEIL